MKKVLVATCVVAMTAFGITNASADTAATARANAYGLDVGGSLLSGLVEREPEVTSVLPPGGLVSEDIITVPAEPLTINGTGVVVAETSAESTIVPFMGGAGGAGGATGGLTGGGGLIGGIFENLLGGTLGGGGGTVGGVVPTGVAANSAGDAGSVQAQQVPQVPGVTGDGGGVLGGVLGGDLLGGLLDQGAPGEELVADGEIVIPAANARGFARIDDLNVVVEDTGALTGLPTEIVAILVDALLEVDVISAEAVAVCVQNQVFFDTAASVVMLQDGSVDLVDDLVNTLGEILPAELVRIRAGEVGTTADGVFVNALHVSILGLPEVVPDATDPTVPDVTDPTVPGVTVPSVPDVGVGSFQTQQLDGGEPLLDIVLGHAEVSATQCAAPPAPLVPTGEDRPSLPVTGGLGVLPAVLGVGLLGGAVAAGRLALRSRGNGDSTL